MLPLSDSRLDSGGVRFGGVIGAVNLIADGIFWKSPRGRPYECLIAINSNKWNRRPLCIKTGLSIL